MGATAPAAARAALLAPLAPRRGGVPRRRRAARRALRRAASSRAARAAGAGRLDREPRRGRRGEDARRAGGRARGSPRRGRRVAILSRGYGATRSDARVVSDGARVLLGAREAGDEPALLARRLPGVARALRPPPRGARRARRGRARRRRAPPRRRLPAPRARARPRRRRRSTPRTPSATATSCRAARTASRARRSRARGLVWLSRVDQAPPGALERLARARARARPGRAPVESRHAPVDVVDGALAHDRSAPRRARAARRVLLLCGLARPGGFRRTLAGLGAEIVAERVFRRPPPLHRRRARRGARARAARPARAVATTEKDAVRLDPRARADPRLCVCDRRESRRRGVLDGALDEALADGAGGRDAPEPLPEPATPAAASTSRGRPPLAEPELTMRLSAGSSPASRAAGSSPRRRARRAPLRARHPAARRARRTSRLAFPEKTEAERRAIARATYRNLGRMVARVPARPARSRADELEGIFVHEGWERFEAGEGARARASSPATGALRELRGARRRAHPARRAHHDDLARRWGSRGATTLWRRTRAAARASRTSSSRRADAHARAIRSLKAGRVLGYVIDQNEPARRRRLPDLLRRAGRDLADAGPARACAPAPRWCSPSPCRSPDGRHRVVIEGPLDPRTPAIASGRARLHAGPERPARAPRPRAPGAAGTGSTAGGRRRAAAAKRAARRGARRADRARIDGPRTARAIASTPPRARRSAREPARIGARRAPRRRSRAPRWWSSATSSPTSTSTARPSASAARRRCSSSATSRSELKAGGAGNAAQNLAALGVKVRARRRRRRRRARRARSLEDARARRGSTSAASQRVPRPADRVEDAHPRRRPLHPPPADDPARSRARRSRSRPRSRSGSSASSSAPRAAPTRSSRATTARGRSAPQAIEALRRLEARRRAGLRRLALPARARSPGSPWRSRTSPSSRPPRGVALERPGRRSSAPRARSSGKARLRACCSSRAAGTACRSSARPPPVHVAGARQPATRST